MVSFCCHFHVIGEIARTRHSLAYLKMQIGTHVGIKTDLKYDLGSDAAVYRTD